MLSQLLSRYQPLFDILNKPPMLREENIFHLFAKWSKMVDQPAEKERGGGRVEEAVPPQLVLEE